MIMINEFMHRIPEISVLWFDGSAGAGKSAISAHIAYASRIGAQCAEAAALVAADLLDLLLLTRETAVTYGGPSFCAFQIPKSILKFLWKFFGNAAATDVFF